MKITFEIDVLKQKEVIEAIEVLSKHLTIQTKGSSSNENQKTKVTPTPTIPEEKKSLKIDLTELKNIASEAVKRTDRVKVKDLISKYGGKIAEVKTEDYEKLAEELKDLV